MIISLICIGAQWPLLSDYFTWDRHLIAAGQWWRIVTGNFTHTNEIHLLMNLAALWLIVHIFKPSGLTLFLLIIANSLFIGIGLLWTDIYRYVGLSGVLHGLFAYGALSEVLAGRRTSGLLLAGVIGKVGWEQCFGASPTTIELIQAPVAIQAHLLGLISGIGLALAGIVLPGLQKKSDKV